MKLLPVKDLNYVLERTRDLWGHVKGKRLFVTGGTGFFGRWLLESFAFANQALGLGAEMVVLTRKPPLSDLGSIEFIQGDLRQFIFPAGSFDYLVHAAIIESGDVFETNLIGTQRVLEFAAQAGVRRLLFTSSGASYGTQRADIDRLAEDYQGLPTQDDPYGCSKRVLERLCVEASLERGFAAVIARCFAFVGPGLPLDRNFAVGNFVRDALGGGPIVVNSDGTVVRSYLYAADLAVWLWTLLLRGQAGVAYNVGSDEAINIADLAQTVAAEISPAVQVRVTGKPSFSNRPRYVPCIDRARAELGLQPWINLREGIRRMADWYRGSEATEGLDGGDRKCCNRRLNYAG